MRLRSLTLAELHMAARIDESYWYPSVVEGAEVGGCEGIVGRLYRKGEMIIVVQPEPDDEHSGLFYDYSTSYPLLEEWAARGGLPSRDALEERKSC